MPDSPIAVLYALSVSGRKSDRQRVINDFQLALGEAVTHEIKRPSVYVSIDYLLWDVNAVDEKHGIE